MSDIYGTIGVDSFSHTCRQTLDFSSRYCSILAPSMAPRMLKWMSMYFPKRDELSLRMVLALPNAERDAREEEFTRAASHMQSSSVFNASGIPYRLTHGGVLLYFNRQCIWLSFLFLDFTFKDGVCLKDLLFNPRVLTTDGCQELQDQFGALSLSCSRFTTGIEPPQNTNQDL